jgi:hypothetical protein
MGWRLYILGSYRAKITSPLAAWQYSSVIYTLRPMYVLIFVAKKKVKYVLILSLSVQLKTTIIYIYSPIQEVKLQLYNLFFLYICGSIASIVTWTPMCNFFPCVLYVLIIFLAICQMKYVHIQVTHVQEVPLQVGLVIGAYGSESQSIFNITNCLSIQSNNYYSSGHHHH